MILLVKVFPNHSAEVQCGVLKLKKSAMCLVEKIQKLDCSGLVAMKQGCVDQLTKHDQSGRNLTLYVFPLEVMVHYSLLIVRGDFMMRILRITLEIQNF